MADAGDDDDDNNINDDDEEESEEEEEEEEEEEIENCPAECQCWPRVVQCSDQGDSTHEALSRTSASTSTWDNIVGTISCHCWFVN